LLDRAGLVLGVCSCLEALLGGIHDGLMVLGSLGAIGSPAANLGTATLGAFCHGLLMSFF
jgi:hypothetical protein